MKTNLKKHLIIVALCFISLSVYSKCTFVPHCYNSLGLSIADPGSSLFMIYAAINPGDSIKMVVQGSGCNAYFSGWFFNGNYLAPGGNQVDYTELKLIPQPGYYTFQTSSCNGCGLNPFPGFTISFATTEINEINYLSNLNINPVPANNNLTISFTSRKPSDYILIFTNAFGIVVRQNILKNISGDFKLEEDLSYLSNGVYYLTIHNSDIIETQKFLKIHQGN